MKKLTAKDVANSFLKFATDYEEFRISNGLGAMSEVPIDGYEICTSISDKLGRVARQVKHFERNDPKEDWPNGLTEATSGILVYMMILLCRYGLAASFVTGMENELNSSIKQWSNNISGCCGGGCGCAGNCGENCACKAKGKSVECACKSKKKRGAK